MGRVAASGGTDLEDELATVEDATEQYRDVRVALQDGFVPGGPYVPNSGWHWTHPKRIQDAAKNGPSLEEPNVLLYADTDPDSPEGHLCLVAAEWGVPVGAQGYTEENQPDLFSTDGTDVEEHWHTHRSFRHLFASGDGAATDPSSLTVADMMQRGRWAEVDPDMSVSPGDEVTADWGLTGTRETKTVTMAPKPHPDLLTLHAWVHLTPRTHALADSNPNVRYVEALPNSVMSERTAKPD